MLLRFALAYFVAKNSLCASTQTVFILKLRNSNDAKWAAFKSKNIKNIFKSSRKVESNTSNRKTYNNHAIKIRDDDLEATTYSLGIGTTLLYCRVGRYSYYCASK